MIDKRIVVVVFTIGLFGVGWVAGRLSLHDTPAPAIVPVVTSAAEVSDLLDQLRLVARDTSEYGTYVRFSLKGVRIKVESKNGDQHEVSAPTLRGAVKQLTAPDGAISAALKEWQAAYPGREGL